MHEAEPLATGQRPDSLVGQVIAQKLQKEASAPVNHEVEGGGNAFPAAGQGHGVEEDEEAEVEDGFVQGDRVDGYPPQPSDPSGFGERVVITDGQGGIAGAAKAATESETAHAARSVSEGARQHGGVDEQQQRSAGDYGIQHEANGDGDETTPGRELHRAQGLRRSFDEAGQAPRQQEGAGEHDVTDEDAGDEQRHVEERQAMTQEEGRSPQAAEEGAHRREQAEGNENVLANPKQYGPVGQTV